MGRMTYLLDTNILSEPTKRNPDPNVLFHFEQNDGHLCTAATIWHELTLGCALLPDSKRKALLQSYLRLLLENGLTILPFDAEAAEWLADERVRLQRLGLATAYANGEIAAIAACHELILVTRNIADFRHYQGIVMENWFDTKIAHDFVRAADQPSALKKPAF